MAAREAPVIIRKVKKVVGGGHHGGAWKVAYADFVTAMMAFFLLMWLINATSPEQKQGIADYFAPASVSASTSGSGGILGGTSLGDDGVRADGAQDIINAAAPEAPEREQEGSDTDTGASGSDIMAGVSLQVSEDARREAVDFQTAAVSLRQAMQDLPELAELSKHVLIDQTPEGLRIQLIDQEGRSMFESGSPQPNARARILLRAIATTVNQLPNRLTLAGHTSAGGPGATGEGDWPSAPRAPMRRVKYCRPRASPRAACIRSQEKPTRSPCTPTTPRWRQSPDSHHPAARGSGPACRPQLVRTAHPLRRRATWDQIGS
jgi:chemotaxis protein MotB